MAQRKLESVIAMICAGQYACIVQHWLCEEVGGPLTPFQIAKELRDAIETPSAGTSYLTRIAESISTDSFISSVRVRDTGSGGAPSAVTLFAEADFPGTFSGTLDAAQVSGCMVCVTADPGTPNGRNYYPGVSEEAYSSGLPEPDYLTAMDNIATVLLAPIQGATNDFTFALKHLPGSTYTNVAHLYLSSTPGTQRRRLMPY